MSLCLIMSIIMSNICENTAVTVVLVVFIKQQFEF